MEDKILDDFSKNELVKDLVITRNGRYAIWLYTYNNNTYGYSSSICSPKGFMTRILDYNKIEKGTKKLIKIYPGCMFIQAKKEESNTLIQIYKISRIDTTKRKILFKRVSNFDKKWDNTSYLKTYKKVIKSTSMRAKKYYNLKDIK